MVLARLLVSAVIAACGSLYAATAGAEIGIESARADIVGMKLVTRAPHGSTPPANYAPSKENQQLTADLAAHQNDYAMILVDSDSLTGTMAWQADWKGKWLGATRIGYPGDILNGEIVQQAHGVV